MMRFRLKELIAEKEFTERRRITLDEIAAATGIHRATLSKIANQHGYNTTTDVLDRLCGFFNAPVGALVERVEDEQGGGQADEK